MVAKSDLIFQQWVASLSGRDKTRNAIQGNFDDLFRALKAEGLSTETAYEYLSKAIKAHEPNAALIKNVHRRIRAKGVNLSENEFAETWCKDIADKANAVFFELFPVETKKLEDEDGPIIYGSMTAKEYKAQRQHAEEYPRLDTAELEKKLLSPDYNPVADIKDVIGESEKASHDGTN